jgi:hypothetical protein
MIRRFAASLCVLCALSLVAGCSSSSLGDPLVADTGTPVADTGAANADANDTGVIDTGAADSGSGDSGATDSGATDSGATDSGALDSAVADSASADSATGEAGATCNALTFGAAASIYISVPASSLGTLTGGAIVDGTYDLVAVETSSTTIPSSYTMQSSWRFAGTTLDQLDQLKTSTLGPLTHRTGSIAVAGATITRTYTCGSTDSTPAALNYDSKLVSGVQTIRIQSGALRLTFEKRP